MPEILRLIGGAGTGKTTRLMQEIDRARGLWGIEQIGFSTMTRAARSVAVGRAASAFGRAPDELSRDGWFRTIHSACLRVTGDAFASILSSDDDEWLSKSVFHAPYKTTRYSEDDDVGTRCGGGDDVSLSLDAWNYARAKMIDLRTACVHKDVPYTTALHYASRYETAKRVAHKFDFTDILMRFVGVRYASEDAKPSRATPIGEVPRLSVWLFDEAQDASKLLDYACRRFAVAPSVERVIICGDPFQSIYGFAGSSSEHFLGWPARQEVLAQSHRCPKAILAMGERSLRRMRGGSYWDRGILAANRDGRVEDVLSIERLVDSVSASDDWLLLARTNFSARKITAVLDSCGIPWRPTSKNNTHSNARIAGMRSLVELEQTVPISASSVADVMKFLPSVSRGTRLITHGAKARYIAESHEGKRFATDDLAAIGFQQPLIDAIKSGAWVSHIAGAKKYRSAVARHGSAIVDNPPVRVGTVHSAKGFEAKNVGLVDAASASSARRQECDRATWDEERRIEYVGVTRASSRLVIARCPSALSVLH